MKLEVGKIYRIEHREHGAFTIRVTDVTDEFTAGIIIKDKTPIKEPDLSGEKFSFLNKWVVKAEELTPVPSEE